jgi:hypothetical protein
MPTIGDSYRIYIKSSLDGLMVIRKKNTIQTSARVAASKDRVRRSPPAKPAHDALVAAGKCPTKRVYRPGLGPEERPVCPIKLMKVELRARMKALHGVA